LLPDAFNVWMIFIWATNELSSERFDNYTKSINFKMRFLTLSDYVCHWSLFFIIEHQMYWARHCCLTLMSFIIIVFIIVNKHLCPFYYSVIGQIIHPMLILILFPFIFNINLSFEIISRIAFLHQRVQKSYFAVFMFSRVWYPHCIWCSEFDKRAVFDVSLLGGSLWHVTNKETKQTSSSYNF
jgi:hypothetical protein